MPFVRLALLALLLVAAVPSVRAQSTALPQLAPLVSARWDFVASFNGQPLSFCQEAYESYNRGHARCTQLVTVALPEYGLNLVAGQVDEVILYDAMLYQRTNDETLWTAVANPIYNPTATLRDLYKVSYPAVLTQLGRVDVDGSSTTQFQYWSLDQSYNASVGGQVVYDLFVTADGYVRKAQLSYRGELSLGQGELDGIYVYRDFNRPITVSPPPAELVKAP